MAPFMSKLRRFVWPALALAALGLMFCEPGESLDPLVTDGPAPAGEDTVKIVPAIAADKFPSEAKTGDTLAVVFSIMDSVSGMPMGNVEVTLSSGTITLVSGATSGNVISVTTGLDGKVSVKLISSDGGAGSIQVSARTPKNVERQKSFPITMTELAPVDNRVRQLSFTALRPTLKADGSDFTELRVLVKDEKNNPIPGEEIRFSATGGLVTAMGITDSSGRTQAILISERINKNVTVTATMVSKGISVQQVVAFNGINLTVSPEKNVLMQNTSNNILVELKDANDVPISGDSVELAVTGATGGFASTGKDSIVVVTNTRGQYRTSVTSSVANKVVIRAKSLGAEISSTVEFTNNTLVLSSSALKIVGDGISTAQVQANIRDGQNNPIDDAKFRWSTTYGSFVQQPFTNSDGNGNSQITLKSAPGTGLAIVNVEAKDKNGNLLASTTINISVTAQPVKRLEFGITPDNISVKVGEAKLMARAFDKEDNVMDGTLISFRLIKGAGGGDEVISPPVAYTKTGLAEAILKAGNVISQYQSVRLAAVALELVANSSGGTDTLVIASSDTVGLTISGPAAKVSVGHDIQKGENLNDGTFALPVSAIVVDVNGNLVADGTSVHFSVQPVGMVFYKKGVKTTAFWPYFTIIDSVPVILPWTDFNNNRRLDPGEEPSRYNKLFPYRGEDMDGNGYINNTGEYFEDIDGDGFWNLNPEPSRRLRIIYDSANALDSLYLAFADYNQNGVLDVVEPFVDDNGNGICDCAGTYNSRGLIEPMRASNSQSNNPFPGNAAVGIDREIPTKLGKSVNKIKYVQSHAWKVYVRVSAEANGIRDTEDFILPVILSGGGG